MLVIILTICIDSNEVYWYIPDSQHEREGGGGGEKGGNRGGSARNETVHKV
jgi:hypothetical protein